MVSKKDFIEFVIDRAEYEHTELSEAWKLLDTKAQATTATAGVFVAAAFVFVRNTSLALNCSEKILLGLIVATLVGTIIFAIRAMRITEVAMSTTGSEALDQIEAIFEKHTLPESLDDRFVGFVADVTRTWIGVNQDLRKKLVHKADLVRISHGMLLGATLLVLLLTVTALVRT
jgi:hypothetical protein